MYTYCCIFRGAFCCFFFTLPLSLPTFSHRALCTLLTFLQNYPAVNKRERKQREKVSHHTAKTGQLSTSQFWNSGRNTFVASSTRRHRSRSVKAHGTTHVASFKSADFATRKPIRAPQIETTVPHRDTRAAIIFKIPRASFCRLCRSNLFVRFGERRQDLTRHSAVNSETDPRTKKCVLIDDFV